MAPRVTVSGEEPDHNMRPPADAVPAMTALRAGSGGAFDKIRVFTLDIRLHHCEVGRLVYAQPCDATPALINWFTSRDPAA
jgi:hypothetical protein